jgi:hypothetical protein
MSQVLADNTWVDEGRVFLERGTRREDVDPKVLALIGSHLWVDEGARPNVDEVTGLAVTGLRDNVIVDGVLYEKGTAPPAEVAAKIGDHMWVNGPPAAAAPEPAAEPTPEPFMLEEQGPPASAFPPEDEAPEPEHELEPIDNTEVAASESVEVPARRGPKSGKAAWVEYAQVKGVDVEAGASRDDIIDALDAAGVPTE